MDSKRRADLQRKLSMGAVPRPPAGLADRIKADIPKYLEAHPAPERFSWSTTMRIAASILTLVATALITRELVEPRQRQVQVARSARYEKVVPAVAKYGPAQSVAEAATAAPAETEISLDMTETLPVPTSAAPSVAIATQSARAAESRPAALAEERTANVADASSDRPAAGVTGGSVSAPTEVVAESMTITEHAPAVAPATPAPLPAPPAVAAAPAPPQAWPTVAAPPPPPTSRTELESLPVSRTFIPHAIASALDLNPSSVFGISVDPTAFAEVRSAIESGSRPRAGSVDVEAVVNYFAGSRAPRRGVNLEVEASPVPIAADGDRAILRFTVDTAKIDVSARGSMPPIARDARLHVEFDPRAVAHFRRIGDADDVKSQSALLYNMSVTGLYELELKPRLRQTQRIATVRLTYVPVDGGRMQTISRVINGRDLAKTWDRASRRHRLAALGAVWSETLNGTGTATEVARRAEELATENPSDTRARELAEAATASSGGGR